MKFLHVWVEVCIMSTLYMQQMIFLHEHKYNRGELFKHQVHVCIEAEAAVKTLIKWWMQEYEISQSTPSDAWFFMVKLKLFNKLEKEYCRLWLLIVYYILKDWSIGSFLQFLGLFGFGLFSISLPLISAFVFKMLGRFPMPALIHTRC